MIIGVALWKIINNLFDEYFDFVCLLGKSLYIAIEWRVIESFKIVTCT